jgi:CDP-diglyceride synthetase
MAGPARVRHMGGNTDVDDGDDRREDEDQEESAGEPPRHPTDRVRIFGAEPAGEATQVVPAVPRSVFPVEGPEPESAVRLTNEPADTGMSPDTVQPVLPGETAVPTGADFSHTDWFRPAPEEEPAAPELPPTELPHWTEAPTGQVPAVLARDPGDNPSWGTTAPTWREEHSDWVAQEEEFDPTLYSDDQVALGSLDESDRTDSDRRPWEFDLPSSGAPATPAATPLPDPGSHDPDVTRQLPAVERRTARPGGLDPDERPGPIGRVVPASWDEPNPPVGRPPEASATPDATEAPAGDLIDPEAPTEVDAGPERHRPTGTTRIGRIRRGGPRAEQVRAKRPEEIDALIDTPLAAEPPGASVTAVPGAGRRRGGSLAGLAAADRSAEHAADPFDAAGHDATGLFGSDPDDDRGESRRRGRGSRRSTDGEIEPVLGGGPPSRRARDPESEERRPSGGIRVRIGTGIAAAVVALLAFSAGNVPSLVLSIVVLTFAAGECFGVLRRAGYHPATLLGLVGTVSLMVAAYDKGPSAIPLVLVLIAAFTLLWYLLGIEQGSATSGTAATLFTVGWVSLFGSYAALLLSPSSYPSREGIAFLLGAIIATVANDVGALVVGGWLGRHPLAPTVSPNKTWEGVLGGAVFSVIISALLVGQIHPWTPSKAAVLGLMVAVIAPIGDLCESLLKRDLHIKDMGTLLPGHGGVLDRIDALLFVLPATYYLVRALHIG